MIKSQIILSDRDNVQNMKLLLISDVLCGTTTFNKLGSVLKI